MTNRLRSGRVVNLYGNLDLCCIENYWLNVPLWELFPLVYTWQN
jgi:hypothetical protein